jgi:hypothetical protein
VRDCGATQSRALAFFIAVSRLSVLSHLERRPIPSFLHLSLSHAPSTNHPPPRHVRPLKAAAVDDDGEVMMEPPSHPVSQEIDRVHRFKDNRDAPILYDGYSNSMGTAQLA